MDQELYNEMASTYEKGGKSALSEPEERLMALINGAKPRNKEEKEMQDQANEILAAGRMIEIPSM